MSECKEWHANQHDWGKWKAVGSIKTALGLHNREERTCKRCGKIESEGGYYET